MSIAPSPIAANRVVLAVSWRRTDSTRATLLVTGVHGVDGDRGLPGGFRGDVGGVSLTDDRTLLRPRSGSFLR